MQVFGLPPSGYTKCRRDLGAPADPIKRRGLHLFEPGQHREVRFHLSSTGGSKHLDLVRFGIKKQSMRTTLTLGPDVEQP